MAVLAATASRTRRAVPASDHCNDSLRQALLDHGQAGVLGRYSVGRLKLDQEQ